MEDVRRIRLHLLHVADPQLSVGIKERAQTPSQSCDALSGGMRRSRMKSQGTSQRLRRLRAWKERPPSRKSPSNEAATEAALGRRRAQVEGWACERETRGRVSRWWCEGEEECGPRRGFDE